MAAMPSTAGSSSSAYDDTHPTSSTLPRADGSSGTPPPPLPSLTVGGTPSALRNDNGTLLPSLTSPAASDAAAASAALFPSSLIVGNGAVGSSSSTPSSQSPAPPPVSAPVTAPAAEWLVHESDGAVVAPLPAAAASSSGGGSAGVGAAVRKAALSSPPPPHQVLAEDAPSNTEKTTVRTNFGAGTGDNDAHGTTVDTTPASTIIISSGSVGASGREAGDIGGPPMLSPSPLPAIQPLSSGTPPAPSSLLQQQATVPTSATAAPTSPADGAVPLTAAVSTLSPAPNTSSPHHPSLKGGSGRYADILAGATSSAPPAQSAHATTAAAAEIVDGGVIAPPSVDNGRGGVAFSAGVGRNLPAGDTIKGVELAPPALASASHGRAAEGSLRRGISLSAWLLGLSPDGPAPRRMLNQSPPARDAVIPAPRTPRGD